MITFSEGRGPIIRLRENTSLDLAVTHIDTRTVYYRDPRTMRITSSPTSRIVSVEQTADDGIWRLARTLYEHVYGEGSTDLMDESLRLNYWLDAVEIAMSYPHLLSLREREEVGL